MMADVIHLADHRPRELPPVVADNPVADALAALPRTAGLATRVRSMIEAGASDVFVDCYIAAWIGSARADVDANRDLHFKLAEHLGALRYEWP
jgi:hypothetical protein